MDLVNSMNLIIEYIDKHLTEDIDNDTLAKIAMCSTYHLSRMFPFLTGVTLSEYIRRRRLTMAALDISQTDISIIDVALKYGYASPTAFTQAFKKMHHIPPSFAKEKGASLILYPKLSFQISLKGDVAMIYRLESKEKFYITGIKEKIQKINADEDFSRITELWKNLDGNTANDLMSLSNGYFKGLLGASANNQDDNYDYYIGATSNGNVTKNTNTIEVPALDWAVFTVTGALPDAMVSVWKRIFLEWFPNSGYESVNAPCLEIYSDGDISASDYSCELWVPIKKSQ